MLTVFYDRHCDLCLAEMLALAKRDKANQLRLVALDSDEVAEEFPWLDVNEANRILHGYMDNGSLLTGLDVTVAAWRLVGQGWKVSFLRWPGISYFADRAYLLFAKHRYRISYWLSGKRCEKCSIDFQR